MAGFTIGDLMRLLSGGVQSPQPGGMNAAQMMRQADPLDFSGKYNTPIPVEKQAAFDKWVQDQTKKTGKNPLGDRYDYDVNGFFLEGAGKDQRGHGTDKFKKPNHPTFSNESKYHGTDGNYGGQWITAPGGSFYEASPLNVRMHGPDRLKQYFQQTEPDIQLLLPPPVPQGIP